MSLEIGGIVARGYSGIIEIFNRGPENLYRRLIHVCILREVVVIVISVALINSKTFFIIW